MDKRTVILDEEQMTEAENDLSWLLGYVIHEYAGGEVTLTEDEERGYELHITFGESSMTITARKTSK